MAMIHSPECGKDISDKEVCPECASRAENMKADGIVSIKLTAPRKAAADEEQNASISADGKVIWEGQVGEVAEIYFDKATTVDIQYHTGMTYFGGYCWGVIDPARGNKYCVYARQSFLKTIIELQPTN